MGFECKLHTVSIYDRGGTNRLGPLSQISRVNWERKRDAISFASVQISSPSLECLPVLEMIEPNRHELVIFRGNERVWEGPITLVSTDRGKWDINARDVFHYVYRTIAHNEYNNGGVLVTPVVDRAYGMLVAELGRAKELLDPPINVVPHIKKIRYSDISRERKTLRHTLPFQLLVSDDIEQLAQTGGLDYTVVGRSIILNDTRVPVGAAPRVSEADFIGKVVVASYGMDSATRAVTTGDEGMYGEAGGVDPYYGEWEILDSMFDEDTEEAPTQNALDNAAAYNLHGKLPVPTVVRIPENSTLNPNGVLQMKHLVPGMRIPLVADFLSRKLTQTQKLNSVTVRESAEDTSITVSMVTAPAPIEEGSS